MQETLINEQIQTFTSLANNYDALLNNLSQIDEELDLVDAKL